MQPHLLGLALSRIRHDAGRHAWAVVAVALLAASLFAMQSVVTSMHGDLAATVERDRPHHLTYDVPAFADANDSLDAAQLATIRSWPGVQRVSARSVAPSGVHVAGGLFFGPPGAASGRGPEVPLVGLDAEQERELVREKAGAFPSPGGPNGSLFIRLGGGTNYTLLEGRWLETRGEALVSRGLATRFPLGSTLVAGFANATRELRVVGVIDDGSAGHLGLPTLFPASVILVDLEDHPAPTVVRGIRIVTEPTYETVRDVALRLRELRPDSWPTSRAKLADYEKRHYDTEQTHVVLQAAQRLIALVGGGTIFGVVLMLNTLDLRTFGVLAALGRAPAALHGYAAMKLLVLLVPALPLGLVLGRLVLAVLPTPELGYDVDFAASGAALRAALVHTSLAALAGGLAATAWLLRQPPAHWLARHD